jgi:uncharacterized protein (DUF2236 family)
MTPVSWKLHREAVLLLGWPRALLLQFAHPLLAQGIADHSHFLMERNGRWHRLWRTLAAMLALTFGTEAEACRTAARINQIHDRVNGRLPEPTGIFAGGRPYSAHDPALLRWVHATLVDSHLRAYALYVVPLADWERDRYCAEASRIEALLGIPAGYLPRTVADLERYLDGMLNSGTIVVTDTARALARELLSPPVPRLASPILHLLRLPAVGLLPPAVRAAYGFEWTDRHDALLRTSARGIRSGLRFVPSGLRCWPAARAAARRLEHTEGARTTAIALGWRSGVWDPADRRARHG